MNTAVAPTEPKKVVSVEILHLDELGYGPNGKHTRREWRAECLENFLAGKEQFEAWQASWKDKINENLPYVSLAAVLTYGDGTIEKILNEFYLALSPTTLDFVAQTFEDNVYAEDFVFTRDTNFRSATFTGIADFSRVTFTRRSNFRRVTFTEGAEFINATFTGDAEFNNATFKGNVYFICAIFIENATFISAMFTGYTYFNSATFKREAYFSSVTFTVDADYSSATFTDSANFFKSKFINQCRFDNELIENTKVWTKETQFWGLVNFENTEIANVGHFERVRFGGEIPNFLGVDNSKTLLIFSGDEYFNKNDTTEDAVKRLAQLKRLADEQGQTDQALMFNALELNAKRAQARDKTKHLTWKQKANNADYWFANATAGFRIFSDYGRSFFEPLKWYLALLGVTFYLAIAHTVYFTNKECPNEYANVFSYLWRDQIQCAPVKPKDNETPIVLSAWRAAVEYTSYRASGILDFADSDKQTIAISNRLFNQPIEPPWMRAWGIFKGIASIALLFLAALGLRNKYRIK